MRENNGRAGSQAISDSRQCSFFFDFSKVTDCCASLRQNPERVALMCQAQVRQIAPDETVIPKENGFHLVVRSRSGAAAEALASEINRALLRRLFGTGPDAQSQAVMFHAVKPNNILPFARSSVSTHRPASPAGRRKDEPVLQPSPFGVPLGWTDFKPGFIPVFHLKQKALPLHLCGPVSVRNGKRLFGTDALRYCHPQYRPAVDIAMLNFGLQLLPEVESGKTVSAIATSVSYETLSWSRSRQLYLEALRAAHITDNASFIIKLEDVPAGTPARRLTDVIVGLKPFAKRVFIDLPGRDTHLAMEGSIGAAGFCASLKPGMAMADIGAMAHRLEQTAMTQRALSCVLGAEDNATLLFLKVAGNALGAKRPEQRGHCFAGVAQDVSEASGQQAA